MTPVRRFEGGMNRQMRPDHTRDAPIAQTQREDGGPEQDSQATAEEARSDANESGSA